MPGITASDIDINLRFNLDHLGAHRREPLRNGLLRSNWSLHPDSCERKSIIFSETETSCFRLPAMIDAAMSAGYQPVRG
jgi:hypothetical protein